MGVASRYATTTLGARIWRITFNDVVGDVPLLETCCDASEEGATIQARAGRDATVKAREVSQGHWTDNGGPHQTSAGRQRDELGVDRSRRLGICGQLGSGALEPDERDGAPMAASVRPMPNNTNKERRVAISFHTWRKEPWRRPDTLIVERRLKGTAATAFINEGWPVPGFATERGAKWNATGGSFRLRVRLTENLLGDPSPVNDMVIRNASRFTSFTSMPTRLSIRGQAALNETLFDVNINVSVWEPENATKVKHAYQDNRTIYRVSMLGAGPLPLLQADDSDCWTSGTTNFQKV